MKRAIVLLEKRIRNLKNRLKVKAEKAEKYNLPADNDELYNYCCFKKNADLEIIDLTKAVEVIQLAIETEKAIKMAEGTSDIQDINTETKDNSNV